MHGLRLHSETCRTAICSFIVTVYMDYWHQVFARVDPAGRSCQTAHAQSCMVCAGSRTNPKLIWEHTLISQTVEKITGACCMCAVWCSF